MIPDLDAIAGLVRDAGRREVLPRFRSLKDSDIREKPGPQDLVTAADLACEAYLSRRLAEMLPGSRVVGEEAAADDPAILDHLSRDGWVWVVDPVDGTYNFAQGDERFAVIVGLVRDGETVAGWIYRPVQDDMVLAGRGRGAFKGGKRLRAPAPAPISKMTGVLYVGARRAPALYARIKEVRDQLGPRHHARCASAEYFGLAEGRIHYAIFTKQLPWDHAAGCLIYQEAGGVLGCLDGTEYHPAVSDVPLLLAPDRACWNRLRDFFLQPAEGNGL